MTRNVAFSRVLSAVALLMALGPVSAHEPEGSGQTDRLLIMAQKICPVAGRDLTKMGGPVKAQIGEEIVFLCCRGCFEGEVQKPHWEQIQSNLIAAQGKCPVMNKPLPKQPASTVLRGRRALVCCPPCTGKMKPDPDKYLVVVDKLLEENLERQDIR